MQTRQKRFLWEQQQKIFSLAPRVQKFNKKFLIKNLNLLYLGIRIEKKKKIGKIFQLENSLKKNLP